MAQLNKSINASDLQPVCPTLHAVHESRFYRPELDCLRLLAFLLVYLHHTLIVGQSSALRHLPGWLYEQVKDVQNVCSFGVSLFFLLSSYLITTLMLRERIKTGKVDLRLFYVRRILRIWPLYFFVVGLALMLGHFLPGEKVTAGRFYSMIFLVGNLYTSLVNIKPLPIIHLWSISVEEQFYLVWPVIIKRLSSTGIVAASVSCTVVSLLLTSFLVVKARHSHVLLWFNTAPHLMSFAFGAGFAVTSRNRIWAQSLRVSLLLAAAGFAIWIAVEHFTKVGDSDVSSSALTPLGYMFVSVGSLFLLTAASLLPVRLLFEPLIYLGKISYGLYVWHVLVLFALSRSPFHAQHNGGINAVVGLPLTILVSMLSFRFLEKPFLKIKRRYEIVATR